MRMLINMMQAPLGFRIAGSNPCVIEQFDLSDSLQEESVTGVQSRRVHVVHIVISTGLPVPCLIQFLLYF